MITSIKGNVRVYYRKEIEINMGLCNENAFLIIKLVATLIGTFQHLNEGGLIRKSLFTKHDVSNDIY